MRLFLLPLSLCLLLLCCDSDGVQFLVDNKLIIVLDQKGTWDQMSIACRREGARMVKIDSADFMYNLVNSLRQNDLVNQNYWIGATEVGHEGIFRWQDGTKVKMGTPFWGIHQGVQEPNGGNLETCVFMVQSKFLYWADALCSDIFSVICEVQGNGILILCKLLYK
ncbi:C-type lectin-like [Penaeus monodon]|uniref:C-type lectin-like n=1 Tax=Penaeus monodon TaxID=6687 RepID=UPI0018A7BC32|nr:C-type lectin-like [Penaeus monodon]